jgi:hypothetical protein
VGTATVAIVVLTPANFYLSEDQNLTFRLSPSLLGHLAKNCRNKNRCYGQYEENQSKKIEKRLLNRLR